MTVIPECVLAREAEICYVSISTVTDYDVWSEIPVSSKEIIEGTEKKRGKDYQFNIRYHSCHS